jgi:hypothetical protein
VQTGDYHAAVLQGESWLRPHGGLELPEKGAEAFLLKMPVMVTTSASPSLRIVCIDIQSTSAELASSPSTPSAARRRNGSGAVEKKGPLMSGIGGVRERNPVKRVGEEIRHACFFGQP